MILSKVITKIVLSELKLKWLKICSQILNLLLEHYSPLRTLASNTILTQLYRLCNIFVFTGLGCQPNAQPPTWRTRVSLLDWNLTLDLPAWETLPVATLPPA
jgi:hypothetical protein